MGRNNPKEALCFLAMCMSAGVSRPGGVGGGGKGNGMCRMDGEV